MLIERLRCESCNTAVEGNFALDWTAQLSREQLAFVKVFVSARGKIKDVEQLLGVSYPTVVNRLDEVVARLVPPAERPNEPETKRRLKILERLSAGEIALDEAERLLRETPKEKK
jgi:hypothetical protein